MSIPEGIDLGVRIKSVKMKSFQSFDDRSVDFPPGLVFVCGPNEAGKTGIMEAIRLGLFADAATQSQAVRQRARWGSDGDFCIQVILEDASGDWVIERDFGSRRNKLVDPNGNVHRDKTEIASIVAGVLGLPTVGAEDAYMASAYVRQDQMQGGGEALKKLLEDRVIGSGIDVVKLARDAETELAALRRGSKGGSSKGELTLAQARVNQLQEELARIRADVNTVSNARADVAESTARERALKEEVDVWTAALAKAKVRAQAKVDESTAQKQLEKILKQKGEYEKLSAELALLRPRIGELSERKNRLESEKGRKDEFDRVTTEIARTRGDSERLFVRIQKAQALLREISEIESRASSMAPIDLQSVDTALGLDQKRAYLEEELQKAEDVLADLNLRRSEYTKAKKTSESEAARLAVLVDAIEQVDRMRSLDETLRRIDDASIHREQAAKDLQAVCWIQDQDLDAARSLEAKIEALTTSSSDLLVEVNPLAGNQALLEIDGEVRRSVDSATNLTAHKSVTLEVQDAIHVSVRTEDAERALGELRQARADLAKILKRYGAAGVREMSEMSTAYRKATSADAEARTRLEATVGGRDVESLRKESVDARHKVAAALARADLALDDIKAMSLPEIQAALSSARDQIQRIDAAISKVDGRIASLELDKKRQALVEVKENLAGLLVKSGCSSIEDMIRLRDQRQDLVGQLRAWRAQLTALLEDRTLDALEADHESLESQVRALEATRKGILAKGPIQEDIESDLSSVVAELRKCEDSITGISARIGAISIPELEREQMDVLTRQMLPAQQLIKDTEAFEMTPQQMAKMELDLKYHAEELEVLKEKRIKAQGILSALRVGAEDLASKAEELEDAKGLLARLQRHEQVLEILRDTLPEARTRAVESASARLADLASSHLAKVTKGKYGRVEVSRELVPSVFSDARGGWIDIEKERDLLSAGT